MIHFKLLAFLCFGLYLAECFLWVWADGWLFLAWRKKFDLIKGPAFRFRNPWPGGFSHRFRLSADRPSFPASLSVTIARNNWESYQRAVRGMDGLGRVLLLLAVSAFLLFAFRRGFALAWGILFFSFLFVHFSLVYSFWSAHGRLYQDRKWERWKGTILCFFSPWQSARARDLLGDGLLEGFHPLIAARILLGEDLFFKFARRWLLELRYPDLIRPDENKLSLFLSSDSGQEEKFLSQWMAGLGLDSLILTKPLEPTHPSHQSYCQRCDVEYDIPAGKCGDCGRDLAPFKE